MIFKHGVSLSVTQNGLYGAEWGLIFLMRNVHKRIDSGFAIRILRMNLMLKNQIVRTSIILFSLLVIRLGKYGRFFVRGDVKNSLLGIVTVVNCKAGIHNGFFHLRLNWGVDGYGLFWDK